MFGPSQSSASAEYEGAYDVIAVRHDNGTLSSMPFVVKFYNVLRHKPVSLWVNGQLIETQMRVNERNEGYFEVKEQDLADLFFQGGVYGNNASDPNLLSTICLYHRPFYFCLKMC